LKVRDIIKLIEAGRVTIAGHPGDDIAIGTLNSIFKQAALKEGK